MHPMERFFALLRPYKGQFIINDSFSIRHKETRNCPIIQAFRPACLSNSIAATVALNEGIQFDTTNEIIAAADNYYNFKGLIRKEATRQLRNKLIQFLEIK